MGNNDKDPTTESWRVFWCGVILLAAIWSVYDWYGQHYCSGTSKPIKYLGESEQ